MDNKISKEMEKISIDSDDENGSSIAPEVPDNNSKNFQDVNTDDGTGDSKSHRNSKIAKARINTNPDSDAEVFMEVNENEKDEKRKNKTSLTSVQVPISTSTSVINENQNQITMNIVLQALDPTDDDSWSQALTEDSDSDMEIAAQPPTTVTTYKTGQKDNENQNREKIVSVPENQTDLKSVISTKVVVPSFSTVDDTDDGQKLKEDEIQNKEKIVLKKQAPRKAVSFSSIRKPAFSDFRRRRYPGPSSTNASPRKSSPTRGDLLKSSKNYRVYFHSFRSRHRELFEPSDEEDEDDVHENDNGKVDDKKKKRKNDVSDENESDDYDENCTKKKASKRREMFRDNFPHFFTSDDCDPDYEIISTGKMWCEVCGSDIFFLPSQVQLFICHHRRHVAPELFSCPTCREGFFTLKMCCDHEVKAHDAKVTQFTGRLDTPKKFKVEADASFSGNEDPETKFDDEVNVNIKVEVEVKGENVEFEAQFPHETGQIIKQEIDEPGNIPGGHGHGQYEKHNKVPNEGLGQGQIQSDAEEEDILVVTLKDDDEDLKLKKKKNTHGSGSKDDSGSNSKSDSDSDSDSGTSSSLDPIAEANEDEMRIVPSTSGCSYQGPPVPDSLNCYDIQVEYGPRGGPAGDLCVTQQVVDLEEKLKELQLERRRKAKNKKMSGGHQSV